MDPGLLRTLLQHESERVEWKESASDADAILRALGALANDLGGTGQPGFLVIGLNNQGSPVGPLLLGPQADEIQQKLAARMTSTKIFPTPVATMEIVEHQGHSLIVVRVDPYPVPPVLTVDGVAFVHVGSTTRRASDAHFQRLRERRPEHHQPFDLRPVRGATISDLQLGRLQQMHLTQRESNRDRDSFPDLESWLERRLLGRRIDGRWTPNAAAILLHGRNPQAYFPGAAIEFVRYGGTNFDAPVKFRRSVIGTLFDQLDSLWTQLNAHLAQVPGPSHEMVTPYLPEYPLEVLRELARNLVQHRSHEGTNAPGRVEWFDDRIEYFNPGAPFGHGSEGEFGAHANYRNPTITAGLVQAGYVEQLGRGIKVAKSLLKRNGNPDLEVETDGFTQVIVRRVL
jgi:ATP-dependent DNA helicase RecG